MMRAALGVMVMSLAMTVPAWAQGTGVSVLLVGDIARFGGPSGDTVRGFSNDGEALTFGLRVDQALGNRWGVELEYVRGGKIENDGGFPRPLPVDFVAFGGESIITQIVGPDFLLPSRLTVPVFRQETRHSTVSALGWHRQPIGDRSSLIYSAGIAFVISEIETTYMYSGAPFPVTLPTVTTSFTDYTPAPIVGIDARIALTDNASLVPGMRVIAVGNGLLLRPAVGLRWQF